ncbi:DoxX family protein [Actinophytocola oryzae]|nr:DoxX family protein [Actinophytocola oryzae]
MSLYLVVAGVTIVFNLAAAVADLTRARFVLDNSAELGIPPRWVVPLGLLKAAGAVGLVVGLAMDVVGLAAAVGLVLFFAGALAVHARARVFHNIAYPGVFFALAVATLVLGMGRT